MFTSAVEWSVNQINENFQLSAELDKYTFDLGGDALTFAKSVWDVSMVLAAVVFAIVACFELHSLSVRNEARGGPMGSAEIVFKVMFKVAVCYVMLQVSFNTLQYLYLTSNSLTEAIGGIAYGSSMDREIINWDEVKDDVPSKFGGLGVFAMSLVVVFVSWAAKYIVLVLILCGVTQARAILSRRRSRVQVSCIPPIGKRRRRARLIAWCKQTHTRRGFARGGRLGTFTCDNPYRVLLMLLNAIPIVNQMGPSNASLSCGK